MNLATLLNLGNSTGNNGPYTNIIPMLVMSGESNSGGQVLNSDATAAELLARPAIQILNNISLVFEDLHIGVNSTISHTGIVDNTQHSWQNGLAGLAETGQITYGKPLVMTGHGGSKISEWNEGGGYANTFNTRVTTALSLKSITTFPKFALLYSQGINDAIQPGFDPAIWIAATVARFAYLRLTFGRFPITMTKFKSFFATLNDAIDQVCLQSPDCYSFTTTDLTLQDIYHWNYQSQKTIAAKHITTLKNNGYLV